MTAHQRNVSASIDPVKLDRLAEVAVKVGLRLQPGQDLLLTAPSVALPLVRRIAEHAYKAGAGIVTPFLSDEEITLARYRYGHSESFDRAAGWLYEGMAKAFAANTARLAIVGDNPMLLSGEDPTKVARASKANSIAYQPALFAGSVLGVVAFRNINEVGFRRTIIVLLLSSGASLALA
jgi:aminopeptidase